MAIADIAEVSVHRAEPKGLRFERRFTREGVHPYDEVEWEIRDSSIRGESGNVFEQKGVEVPKFWSQTATNVVASKSVWPCPRGRVTVSTLPLGS